MKRLTVAVLVVAVAGLVGVARAEDKANATGTWKWTVSFGGNDFEMMLKLKQEGDKLTGTLIRGDRETKIEDGKVKGDEISFTVTTERNGNKVTRKYSGKISGDTIKGKTEFERNGEAQSRDWEAKRDKA